MKSKNSISRHVVDFGVLMVLVGFFVAYHSLKQEPSRIPAIPNRNSPIPAAWTHQNIYIEQDDQSVLVTAQNKLIFIGSYAPGDEPFHVIALDKYTGNKTWQYGSSASALAVSDHLVFVGQVGSVTALAIDDGRKVWSTNLPFTRSVTKLVNKDKVLHVDTASSSHFLLDTETGQILRQIPYSVDDGPNMDIPNLSDHIMDLDIVENVSFFQRRIKWPNIVNVAEAKIVAIDEFSGNPIWIATVPAINRLAANLLGVYVLTLDGELLRLDTATGSSEWLTQFTPAPIIQYYYYVAVDKDDQMLFVYFEDSAQLFAYRLPIVY